MGVPAFYRLYSVAFQVGHHGDRGFGRIFSPAEKLFAQCARHRGNRLAVPVALESFHAQLPVVLRRDLRPDHPLAAPNKGLSRAAFKPGRENRGFVNFFPRRRFPGKLYRDLAGLMYHFNQLYIFGIFANLFCVTLMSISMWAALAGFMFQPLVPVIGALCMRAAECVVFIMVHGAGLVRFVPWTALQPTLPYLLPYVLYVVFLLGAVLVKKDFRRRYALIALPFFCMAVCLCLLAHGRDRSAQAISFSIKNSFLAAVRWPDHRVWIFGSGPETPSYSTYRRAGASVASKNRARRNRRGHFPGLSGKCRPIFRTAFAKRTR